MLPHVKFAALRLSSFVPQEEISPLDNWEFLDRLWVGEAVGFSEWLRDKGSPTALGSLSLDLELSEQTWDAVLVKIGLPLKKGMPLSEVEAVLGTPREVQAFVGDRKSYNFRVGAPEAYDVSCTIHDRAGLIYLVVTVPLHGPDA